MKLVAWMGKNDHVLHVVMDMGFYWQAVEVPRQGENIYAPPFSKTYYIQCGGDTIHGNWLTWLAEVWGKFEPYMGFFKEPFDIPEPLNYARLKAELVARKLWD